jgi:hypothetical protein
MYKKICNEGRYEIFYGEDMRYPWKIRVESKNIYFNTIRGMYTWMYKEHKKGIKK